MIRNVKTMLAAGLMAFAGMTSQAYSNNASVTTDNKPIWSVVCNNHITPSALRCHMQQTVFAGQTKTRIFSATISKVGKEHMLMLALPHGLNLLEGVQLSIDSGNSAKFPIHTADVNGAYAHILLTDAMAKSMKQGNILSLNVIASSQSPIELQLSLAGFSSAFDLLRKN